MKHLRVKGKLQQASFIIYHHLKLLYLTVTSKGIPPLNAGHVEYFTLMDDSRLCISTFL